VAHRVGGLWFVASACILTCCSGDASANDPGAIQVKLEDFLLHASTTTSPSGDITLHLENDGPSTHELNVDKTDLAADQLPLRTDGLSVAEDSPLLTRIKAVEILESGDTANMELQLSPGHYVLYCNLEGHYLGHMYATLDVH
jgi:uncharacterized cupredoxin-like copper-binding protein